MMICPILKQIGSSDKKHIAPIYHLKLQGQLLCDCWTLRAGGDFWAPKTENILDTFLEYAKFGFNMCFPMPEWL